LSAGSGPSAKTGFAATGLSSNDFWNFYTRDDGQGGYRTFGALSNLLTADNQTTSVGLTIANAPGAWGVGSTDPMYDTYLYPFNGGNVTVTVTNLPVGQYDFYVYGWDGNYNLTVGASNYGTNVTYQYPAVNPPVWTQGAQYALFPSVSISYQGPAPVLTVRPGINNYAVISGIQVRSSGR
jgi:hypothetical protein